jgi:hypothetical protein
MLSIAGISFFYIWHTYKQKNDQHYLDRFKLKFYFLKGDPTNKDSIKAIDDIKKEMSKNGYAEAEISRLITQAALWTVS